MSENLRQTLASFAAHLRDPARAPAPAGIDPRRLQVYRRLYLNTLDTLLSSNFPVLRRTLDPLLWRQLVDGFARDHRADSPLFTEVGQEFIDYLSGQDTAAVPAWLPELAHYEWIELDLLLDESPPAPPALAVDPLTACPRLAPLVRVLGYRWPVHRIGPDFVPQLAPVTPSWLLARRAAGRVRFAELSPVAAALLTLLSQAENGTDTGSELLARLADQSHPVDRDGFVRDGTQLLRELHQQGAILCRAPPPT